LLTEGVCSLQVFLLEDQSPSPDGAQDSPPHLLNIQPRVTIKD
jgi:hypothetical protein